MHKHLAMSLGDQTHMQLPLMLFTCNGKYSGLCFSAFQRDSWALSENPAGQSADDSDHSNLANPGVVFSGAENDSATTPDSTERLSNTTPGPSEKASLKPNASTGGNDIIRNSFRCAGFLGHIAEILLQSWCSGTHIQYRTYHQRWLLFCNTRKIDSVQPFINDVLEFLYSQYSLG